MNAQPLFFLFVVFAVTAGVAGFGAWLMMPDRVRQRIGRIDENGESPRSRRASRWNKVLGSLAQSLARVSQPAEGWENSAIKLRFMNAGWRSAVIPVSYFAAKTVIALLAPLLLFLFGGELLLGMDGAGMLLSLALAALSGYLLPNVVLNHLIEKRQREIFEGFPDALDLLIICVESGLSLDQAISRVADEIGVKSKTLADELQLVLVELRNGFSKEVALRRLALRTGVEEIDLLVAMLVQADRFGTSIGDSLRVHADNLRTKRRQRAEEAAAKIAVKLLLPLVFMIFPSLLLVMMGPAMMQVYRVLLPTMMGQ